MNKKKQTINDRIEMIINERFDGNKSAFARAAQLDPSGLGNYLGNVRRSRPGLPMIEKIISNLDVDARWLITGEETPHKKVSTRGDFSPASMSGDISLIVSDAVLAERVKALEAIIAEKDQHITTLKELITELKER